MQHSSANNIITSKVLLDSNINTIERIINYPSFIRVLMTRKLEINNKGYVTTGNWCNLFIHSHDRKKQLYTDQIDTHHFKKSSKILSFNSKKSMLIASINTFMQSEELQTVI